jgi:multiple sugar transport system substrate-binding protein
MKHLFTATFLILVLLSAVAWMLEPQPRRDGKTVMLYLADDNDIRQEQVALFNKLNPKYHVDIDPGATDMTKVVVQCMGGVGPDLFNVYDGLELSNYVKAGIAWDLTDELPKLGVDIDKDVWRAADACYRYEGRIYGFPKNVCTNAVWYNKALFDAQRIPYPKGPWTWEEFLTLARKLTLRDQRGRITQYGLLLNWPQGDGGPWMHFIRQWGGSVYSPCGTHCTLDCPECIAAIQFIQDLIYKYRVTPTPGEEDALTAAGSGWGSAASSISLFAGGRAAMALGGNYWQVVLKDYKNLRLGAVESPHGPRRVYHGYGTAVIINKNSPRRRDALEFIKFFAGRPYNELVNAEADGLGPIRRYCFTDAYLKNIRTTNADNNEVWRDVMQFGVPDQDSPFINGMAASIIIFEQLDLVRNNNKTAAQTMRDATTLINAEIKKSLQREPDLRPKYEAALRKEALAR